jgi:Family of unknown function (DUF6812)
MEAKKQMSTAKKVRVRVRTVNASYEGDLLIPPMRNRVSDLLNEEVRVFINLTDVSIDGVAKKIPFISVNKNLIESIVEE